MTTLDFKFKGKEIIKFTNLSAKGTVIGMILFALLILAAIIFIPMLVIWALNTLFALSIAYTFINWAAVYVLIAVFRGGSSSSSNTEK